MGFYEASGDGYGCFGEVYSAGYCGQQRGGVFKFVLVVHLGRDSGGEYLSAVLDGLEHGVRLVCTVDRYRSSVIGYDGNDATII